MNSPRPDKSKLYYPKMPAMWWLKQRSYFLFMIRELSSVFIGLFLVVFLIQIYQLGEGQESYMAFVQKLRSPGWIIFHIVALLFALFHSITWFKSSSVVLQLKLGGREFSRGLVTWLHIGAWFVISVIIFWLFIVL